MPKSSNISNNNEDYWEKTKNREPPTKSEILKDFNLSGSSISVGSPSFANKENQRVTE